MKFIIDESEINIGNGLVLFYFYDSESIFHSRIINDIDKYDCYGINVKLFPNMIARFELESLPSIVIRNKGKNIKTFTNLLSEKTKSNIDTLCKKQENKYEK